jgi:hypothetical protein
MVGKKIKLEDQVISETLVADTDSKSGDEASDVEEYFEEQQQQQQQKQASTEAEPQAATSGRLPTW